MLGNLMHDQGLRSRGLCSFGCRRACKRFCGGTNLTAMMSGHVSSPPFLESSLLYHTFVASQVSFPCFVSICPIQYSRGEEHT